MRPPIDLWASAAIAADVAWMSHADAATRARRRQERLGRLLDAAARGSPLYRRLIGERDPRTLPLSAVPVAHKPELMAQFDAWVTDPRLTLPALRRFASDPALIGEPFADRFVVWESSGSSGEPGLFVQDAAAMAVYDALEALRRPNLRGLGHLFDPWGWSETMVFVGATSGHFASMVSIERLRRLNPLAATRLRSVSILQPAAVWMAQLSALAPTVIATYPSAAVMLAQAKLAGETDLAPRELWLGGETLTPTMRALVQRAFGAAVSQSYGASEFLAIAAECAHGQLHLNDDWAILEPVDADFQPVPAGTPGVTTLLTNLANHVQPLIRYDLGDRVTLHERRCACGSALPVIEVQGRADDTLHIGPAAHATPLLPLAIGTVLEDEAGLFDYHLVQDGQRTLRLSTPRRGAQAEASLLRGRDALLRFIAAQGGGAVRIRCRSGVDDVAGRSGKRQRIVCALGSGRLAMDQSWADRPD
jgi:phenylacetate-coenzyme A ligase PaaK-like adenylate-forming protein